jgi:hypothetical protein
MTACRSDACNGETKIEHDGNSFTLDAALIGELLDVPPADVPALMRTKSITSVCESGIDADRGTSRLNLFYHGRHVRLRVGSEGQILHRSIIDFGERALPLQRRRQIASEG